VAVSVAIELIEGILTDHRVLFLQVPAFAHLLKDQVRLCLPLYCTEQTGQMFGGYLPIFQARLS